MCVWGGGPEVIYTVLSIEIKIPLLNILVQVNSQGPLLLCYDLPRIYEKAILSC